MQAWQSYDPMSSDTHAMDQLHDFLRQRREAREPVEDLTAFAQELHRHFVAAEREALGHELARFDLDVPAIEVEGERCHRVLRCETTSASAAGPVRVERRVYRHPPGDHAVCPRELRAGIIAGGHEGDSLPRWPRHVRDSVDVGRGVRAGAGWQRIVLPALLDDDVGNRQRPDVDGAVEADWSHVRLRQVRAVRRLHSTNADALRKSDTERIGTALFWLDLGSHRTL